MLIFLIFSSLFRCISFSVDAPQFDYLNITYKSKLNKNILYYNTNVESMICCHSFFSSTNFYFTLFNNKLFNCFFFIFLFYRRFICRPLYRKISKVATLVDRICRHDRHFVIVECLSAAKKAIKVNVRCIHKFPIHIHKYSRSDGFVHVYVYLCIHIFFLIDFKQFCFGYFWS